MDDIETMKSEASSGQPTWRENNRRLIWCGMVNGEAVFRNTVSATTPGPRIGEPEAARLLASEGPWRRPSRIAA